VCQRSVCGALSTTGCVGGCHSGASHTPTGGIRGSAARLHYNFMQLSSVRPPSVAQPPPLLHMQMSRPRAMWMDWIMGEWCRVRMVVVLVVVQLVRWIEWCRDCRCLCNFVGTNYLQKRQTNMAVGGMGVVVDYVMDSPRGKLPLDCFEFLITLSQHFHLTWKGGTSFCSPFPDLISFSIPGATRSFCLV